MKEYPATSKSFKVNGKVFKMQKLTLGLQLKIEDENIPVTYRDILEGCTDMKSKDIDALHVDQFDEVYSDVIAFSYESNEKGGETKKP